MRLLIVSFAFCIASVAGRLRAQVDEPPKRADVAATYARIVADYQQIEATRNPAARDAAGRLVSDAYRLLIDQATKVADKSADDLYALGACHEGLGDRDVAGKLYAQSLAAEPSAKVYLALVRVNVAGDLGTAEQHFAAAQQVDPQYPGLSQFHLLLANAYSNKQQWREGATHLQRYLVYVKALAESQPGNRTRNAVAMAVKERLKVIQQFADLTGKPVPEIKATHWIQGDATDLSKLKGKVVAIDFCAMWAAPSRFRMERMKKLQAKYGNKGFEVVGVSLAYGHGYDPVADTVDMRANRTIEEERDDWAAFAKKHKIGYRLALIDRATTEAYGVTSLPHTVLVDAGGAIRTIVPSGGEQADAILEAKIMDLLGLP